MRICHLLLVENIASDRIDRIIACGARTSWVTLSRTKPIDRGIVLKLRKSTLFWTGERAQSEAYFRQITYLAGFLSTLIIPKRGEEPVLKSFSGKTLLRQRKIGTGRRKCGIEKWQS